MGRFPRDSRRRLGKCRTALPLSVPQRWLSVHWDRLHGLPCRPSSSSVRNQRQVKEEVRSAAAAEINDCCRPPGWYRIRLTDIPYQDPPTEPLKRLRKKQVTCPLVDPREPGRLVRKGGSHYTSVQAGAWWCPMFFSGQVHRSCHPSVRGHRPWPASSELTKGGISHIRVWVVGGAVLEEKEGVRIGLPSPC